MATVVTKKTTMVISKEEEQWLAFANLALANIAGCIEQMDGEILNENTGEILEVSDINKAFSLIETLIDKDAVWIKSDEWESAPQDDDYEPFVDECGFNPYMGCYDYDC